MVQGPLKLAASRVVCERIESTVEVQDGSINALIGGEDGGVFVAEVRSPKHAAELLPSKPVKP
jgi:hypothetical protein